MRLALTAADVTGPATEDHPEGQLWAKVTVMTRNGRLVLQSRAGVPLHSVEASAVRDSKVGTLRTWAVETVEGTFHVARKKGGG